MKNTNFEFKKILMIIMKILLQRKKVSIGNQLELFMRKIQKLTSIEFLHRKSFKETSYKYWNKNKL